MRFVPRPNGDLDTTRAEPKRVRRPRSLNRVWKIFAAPWNDFGGFGVIPAAGYSPCPIDRRRRVRPWWCRSHPAFFCKAACSL